MSVIKLKNTLYHQLYEKLKKQIIEGQFKEGDKFYSKRQLSKHLSISQTTVEHAYQRWKVTFIQDLASESIFNNFKQSTYPLSF